MSYQTSSKPSTPFCLLIGARKTKIFWHQSEDRTAATVWNWSGKTLSPGALLTVLYFSLVPYFPACLDFPLPSHSAPGSPRMAGELNKNVLTNLLVNKKRYKKPIHYPIKTPVYVKLFNQPTLINLKIIIED